MNYNSIPKSELAKLDKLTFNRQLYPIEIQRTANLALRASNDKVDKMMADKLREGGY